MLLRVNEYHWPRLQSIEDIWANIDLADDFGVSGYYLAAAKHLHVVSIRELS